MNNRAEQLRKQGERTRAHVMDFIKSFYAENRYSPSIREICQGTGLKSTSSVFIHLETLEQQGKISVARGKFRTITIKEVD